jgi:HAE1 family hydrophobic/amphiphilic exporter-1
MAWVIIGGLSSSLMLTLFVVPTMYYIIETLKNKFQNRKSKKQVVA